MRAAARLLAVVGALAVGLLLFRAAPRDVTLVYDVAGAPGASGLEVVIRRGGEVVRRADLAVPAGRGQVRHAVRLADGDYLVDYRMRTAAGTVVGQRSVTVSESGTVILPLAP